MSGRRLQPRVVVAAVVPAAIVLAAGIAAVVGQIAGDDGPQRMGEVTVVLREGLSMLDYAKTLEAAGVTGAAPFLDACRDRRLLDEFGIDAGDAEGFLFPDTYRFFPATPADRVVRRLLSNFRRRVGPALESRRDALKTFRKTLRRDPVAAAITIASIVEAETPTASERPVIASVAWNRLTGLDPSLRLLQMDPTATYGCRRFPDVPSCTGYSGGEPTRAILADPANPYNTYRIEGLPPGPIGNPGLAAIEAVLERKRTPYLYYVSRGDGTHQFSRTHEEHAAAVKRWRGR